MGKISSFITGAALGAVAALLFAPKSGEQTRAFVTEKANAVVGEAKDFGAGVPDSLMDVVKTAQTKGQEIASGATAKIKGAADQVSAPAPAQPDDDLRQKIEAARQRIAAQVMENAEASKAVEVAAGAEEAAAE